MATYEYQCEKCEHYFTALMPMSEMLAPEEDPCPNCKKKAVKKVIMTAPALGDSARLGITKPDGGFKEVLQKIHENNRGSNLHRSRYI